ncbi:MAG TPA: dihydrofolate reductase family protein [Solirubrobacteraceae bacterium]|nr:dihydrofolate reductase family protein [Solirubrobacteraceae bacterium]
MRFNRLHPPAEPAEAESIYTRMALGERAPDWRPHVVANFVSSADGKATFHGRSGPLGASDGDRRSFHLLRTQVDAILAGTGTLGAERYGRMVRDEQLAQIRVAEGLEAQPLSVTISRSGAVPFDIPLFADERSTVALYAPDALQVPPGCAASVHLHPLADGPDALAGVMRSLRAEHGVRSLLLEGGPTLLGAMVAEDLVDELFLTVATALAGGAESAVSAGPPLARPLELELVWVLERDGHLFLRYARRR